MKYLRGYNESVKDIESVSHTLIMEIFDEFNIFYCNELPNNLTSKYWTFINEDTIRIGNIESEEYTNVVNELHYIRYMIRVRTGVEYDLKYSSAFNRGYIDLEIVK